MGMELFASLMRITQDGNVLLDIGDYLEGMIQIEPAREMQVAKYAGGNGARTFDRGNVMHQVSYVLWRLYDTAAQALAAQLAYTRLYGARLTADVQLRVTGYGGYVSIHEATTVDWRSMIHDRVMRMQFVIVGGAMGGTLSLGDIDRVITDQAGVNIASQAGVAILDQEG